MGPSPNPGFRRLRWRLTLSYVFTTVASLLLVQLLAGLLSTAIALSPFFDPAAALAEYQAEVHQKTRNPETLAALASRDLNWLRERLLREAASNLEEPEGFEIVLITNPYHRVYRILDPAGAPLVGTAPHSPHIARWILPAQTLYRRSWGQPGELPYLLFAVPILSTHSQLLGYVEIEMRMRKSWLGTFGEILVGLAPSALLFSLLASLAGLAFGSRLARRITGRLEELGAVTADWSQGRFATRIPIRGHDEMDQLGQRLNLMADDLSHALAIRQEVGRLEERNRLARDLHDTVKQHLFAASMQAGALRHHLERLPGGGIPKSVGQSLGSLERLIREVQLEIQEILDKLRPAPLETDGLSLACQRVLDLWQGSSPIPLQAKIEPGLSAAPQIEIAFRRILSEALSNVARHSQARHVCVSLAKQNGRLALSVSDDGIGLPPASPKKSGMGLLNIHERAESLPGGSCQISSEPGQGTRLLVSCLPSL